MTTPRPWRGVVVCETVVFIMDEKPVVDFDLGELSREPELEPPPPRLPLRERLTNLGLPSWRIGWRRRDRAGGRRDRLAGGWQPGAHRRLRTAGEPPPVMAWVIDDGPNSSSSPADPHTILELHVANLGARPVRLNTLVPQTDRGFATAQFLARSRSRSGRARRRAPTSRCIRTARPYVKASLEVQFSVPAADRPNRRVVIDDSADPSLGNSFLLALNQVCARPTANRTENGVDGVFVEQTSSAVGAALVLTNGTPNPRKIDFATLESDGFRLLTSPGTPIVLAAGTA